MEPFYFGEPGRRLFGVVHEPVTAPTKNSAVVLCAPLWQEAVRAQRVLRQLGVRLARAGSFTFRFDYYGTGDSEGDTEAGDVESWLTDIGAAVEEAKKAKGVARVTLLGLRFGASLAALAAAARTDVDRLVLWEPVVDGRKFLDQGMADHRAWRDTYHTWRMMPPSSTRDDGSELLGFPITLAMRGSISAVDLFRLPRTAARILVVERDPSTEGARLAAHLGVLGAQIDHEVIPEAEAWKRQSGEATASSRKTFECIATWLGRSPR